MKIKDKIYLGTISGLIGTLSKNIVVSVAKKLNFAEFNGVETAAGMMLPGHKITTPGGRVVGHIGNSIVGATLGVATTYILSTTGREKSLFKGTVIGGASWAALYGTAASLGGSSTRPALPKTLLSNFVGHLVFGAVTAYTATHLGDPRLFDGQIPLAENNEQNQQQNVIKFNQYNDDSYQNQQSR